MAKSNKKSGKKPKSNKKAAPPPVQVQEIDHAEQIDSIVDYLKESGLGDDFADCIGNLIRDRFAIIEQFSPAADENEGEPEVEEAEGEAADADGAVIDAGDGEGEAESEADAPEAAAEPEPGSEGEEAAEGEEGEEEGEPAEAEAGDEGEGEAEGEEATDEPEADEPEPEPAPAPKKGKGKPAAKGKKAKAEEAEADDSSSEAPDWSHIGVTPAMVKAALAELNDDAKAAAKLAKELGFPLPKSMAGKKSSDAEKLAYVASVAAAHAKLTDDKMTVKALEALAKKAGIEVKLGRTKKPEAIKAKFAEALIGSVTAEM